MVVKLHACFINLENTDITAKSGGKTQSTNLVIEIESQHTKKTFVNTFTLSNIDK